MIKNFAHSIRNYNDIVKRFAGHSKWANIKHTKGLKDSQRAKAFTKLGQHIKVAIAEGGSPNPAFNLKLQQVISQAKRISMPAATIESIIKSTQKDPNQFKSHIYEIKGPGGCIILCEVFSANLHKTKNEIAAIIKKHSSKYTDPGVRHIFVHKGLVETEVPSTAPLDEVVELATNHAIECEAEDVVHLDEEKLLQFVCNPHNFEKVQKHLEEHKYKIVNAELQYVPNLQASLSDTELEICSNMYDKLEAMAEVVKLHDNIG